MKKYGQNVSYQSTSELAKRSHSKIKSDKIKADVEKWLAEGGEIEYLDYGLRSDL